MERLCIVREYKETLNSELIKIQLALSLTVEKIAFYQEISKNHLLTNLSYLEEWEMFRKRGKSIPCFFPLHIIGRPPNYI